MITNFVAYLSHLKVYTIPFKFNVCLKNKIFVFAGTIVKAVQAKPSDLSNGPESNMTIDQHRLLIQYKDVIREQDQQLTGLSREYETLKEEYTKISSQFEEQAAILQQLKDQNALLKAQKSASSSLLALNDEGENATIRELKAENEFLKQQIHLKDDFISNMVRMLLAKEVLFIILLL